MFKRWWRRTARWGAVQARSLYDHIYSSLGGHLPVFYDIHKSCRERFTRNIFRLMLIARRPLIVLMLLACAPFRFIRYPRDASTAIYNQ